MAYAHTPNDKGYWHELPDHLRGTATLAEEFAAAFDAGELARYIGLWHDLGKFNPKFQAYLAECARDPHPEHKRRGPDHKAAGAHLAMPYLGALAMLIQGHHGGLHDPTSFKTWLDEKFDSVAEAALREARATIPDLEPAAPLALPSFTKDKDNGRIAFELFARILFSALTDADFLDTERHFNVKKAKRRESKTSIATLWQRLEQSQASISGQGGDTVSRVRHEIYQACLDAAEQRQGFFRLTVPTGGGKTRSAMGFALKHALKHDLRRVIVAVPFTTITEQTARTYRSIFAPDANEDAAPVVLEHHSGANDEHDDDEGEFHESQEWSRLAAENWEAPIIVTTTVQLFESLFAKGTSRCRKLHRLARSVIILDEAQALPSHLLQPILSVLTELCAHYHTSVVISTATQPAFDSIPGFAELDAQEIVPAPKRYFTILKRVNYEWQIDTPTDWPTVAQTMNQERQALTVVNTKKHALELFDALGEGALHLSTLLCGAHRRRTVAEVRRRLKGGAECRLVSTQVIEAGVDLDFPMVMRAIGPLSSIVQAAGRCNREGKLGAGRVIIFRPEENTMPPGAYYTAAKITNVLQRLGDLDELDDPATSANYFKLLFEAVELDREGIQTLRQNFAYPEVAKRFKMIEDDTESVVITDYGSESEQREVRQWLDLLKRGVPYARALLRKLQPYTVAIRKREAEKLAAHIEQLLPGIGIWLGDYDEVSGLSVPTGYNLERFVVLFVYWLLLLVRQRQLV